MTAPLPPIHYVLTFDPNVLGRHEQNSDAMNRVSKHLQRLIQEEPMVSFDPELSAYLDRLTNLEETSAQVDRTDCQTDSPGG